MNWIRQRGTRQFGQEPYSPVSDSGCRIDFAFDVSICYCVFECSTEQQLCSGGRTFQQVTVSGNGRLGSCSAYRGVKDSPVLECIFGAEHLPASMGAWVTAIGRRCALQQRRRCAPATVKRSNYEGTPFRSIGTAQMRPQRSINAICIPTHGKTYGTRNTVVLSVHYNTFAAVPLRHRLLLESNVEQFLCDSSCRTS